MKLEEVATLSEDVAGTSGRLDKIGKLADLFTRVPLWLMLILGFIYSVSISWNINGISHNFIHNPYFRSPFLNRLFSVLESVSVGFSQVFYDCIHMQHHKGNADRPNETGETID